MGFGSYSFSSLTAIRTIAFQVLGKFTTEQIFDTGVEVARLLQHFKDKRPEEIPNNEAGGGGLLGNGLLEMAPLPMNDFQFARHLVATNDPDMEKIVRDSKGVPVLLAYLAVLTNGKDLPPDHLIEYALPYAVDCLAVESEVSKLWNRDLQTRIERLQPLATKGAKFQGKKVGALGPLAKAVRSHLKDRPEDSADAIWAALVASPPKGLIFLDNAQGRYVEYDKRTFAGLLKNTSYRRFANIVTEQRKSLNTHGLANP